MEIITKQPDAQARLAYDDIVDDKVTVVHIKGTRKKVRLRGIKPGTLKYLTRLWIDRDMAIPNDSSEALKSMAIDPFFSIKEACLIVLNSYWKIKLIYPFMWRWWGYVKGYTEDQMTDIIMIGKKKIPLMSCWTNMVLSADMRTDLVKMTTAEVSQYQAALLSAANQLS